MLEDQQIFVAQSRIPLDIRGSTTRSQLVAPAEFGVTRGYWDVYDEIGQDSTSHGVELTVEFLSPGLKEAEHHAMGVARRFGAIVGFAYGARRTEPVLTRIAQVGANLGLIAQHNYRYLGDERHGTVPADTTTTDRVLGRLAAISDQETRTALMLGLRWQRQAISIDDPMDSFLASWIGLEGLRNVLAGIFHPNGPAALCETCGNEDVTGRKRGNAALEHLFKAAAPEFFTGRSVKGLMNLRNDIAHSLRDETSMRSRCIAVYLDCQLVLAVGCLTILARALGSTEARWSSILPRDRESRPDYRYSVQCREEYVGAQPFNGEWAKLISDEEWTLHEGEDGSVVWRMGADIEWELDRNRGPRVARPITKYSLTWFDRSGTPVVNVPELSPRGITTEEEIESEVTSEQWRITSLPESWNRVIERGEAAERAAAQAMPDSG